MKYLPPDSAYRTEVRDSMTSEELDRASAMSNAHHGHGAWSLTDHLLARTGDLLEWQLYQAGGGQGRKPKPFPRPGVSETVDLAALAVLQRRRENRGATPTT